MIAQTSAAATRLPTALLALVGVVIALAGGLVAVGLLSYDHQVESARAALRARLFDRAFGIQVALRDSDPEEREALEAVVRAFDSDGGYARLVRHDGTVRASSDGAEKVEVPRDFRNPAERQPVVQTIRRDGGEAMEIWIPAAPPRPRPAAEGPGPPGLGPPFPTGPPSPGGGMSNQRPGPRNPLMLVCVGLPADAASLGLTRARFHLGLTLAGVVFLLALGMLWLTATRRAARLSVEVERRQRLASLGQLAAILAHEIRTPLAAVKGNAQLLLERLGEGDARQRKPAERVVGETERLARLVDDLLSYARPAAPTFTEIDVAAVAEASAERLASTAGNADVRLMVDAVEPVLVHADLDRLTQVIDNLVLNAIQASPEGETVLIRVRSTRSGARVEVADRGPGVPAAERAAIFEPFRTSRPKGTGLGLAVVRRIADEHGAEIAVEERPGGGALFVVTLRSRPPSPIMVPEHIRES